MATHQAPFCGWWWVGAGFAWRRHAPTPWIRSGRPAGQRRPMASPPFLRALAGRSSRRRGVGAFRAAGLGWAAGVGQADLAAGGQGSVRLAGLLGEEAAAFGGGQERLVDLAGVEGAGGAQVVKVAGRLPELPVA